MFHDNIDRIALVVLDVMMPNLNGHDALRQIRMLKPDVLAVMCTGYDPETTAAECYLDSDVPLLQKPFEPETLLHIVREVLDKESCEAI
jgi:DNA-binding NtrC family response regulator